MISIAFFIPLIIATAGNTGTQSASLIISGLALGEIDLRKWFKVFIREILTGLVMGVILAIFGTLAVYALGGNIVVSLIVSSTLLIMIIVGSTLGSMLPLIFKHFNIDPALTSSPFVTTSLDVIGILVYIGVSTLIINHLF
jgi:magnesium transporter